MTDHKNESGQMPESAGEREKKLRLTKDTLADLDAKELEKDADAVKGGRMHTANCMSI